MALLSNKTPIECMLGNFEKNDIQRIYAPAVDTICSGAQFRNKHFAFSLDPFLKKKITQAGVELYPNGYVPHSHPFSKTLENHILFDILPGVINSDSFTMCSIKENKVKTFKARCRGQIDFLNRLIDGRDIARYPEVSREAAFNVNLCSADYKFSKNFIKVVGKKKNIFFHDEVHHWSKKSLFKFLEDFEPSRFIFTIVYPPELLGNYANSQNPKMYTFKINGSNLFFFPDGVTSEGYQQQLNLKWLFQAKTLINGKKKWTVIRHKSIYAHHLFEIVPGELCSEDTFYFNDFDVVDMSIMFQNRFKSYELFPVKLVHIYKVYSYLLCLKKPDVESGLAKLRQTMGDDADIKEFLFFEQFCKRIIQRGTSYGMFGYSLFEKICRSFIDHAPKLLTRWSPTWKKCNTFEFLMNLGTLNIEVKRGNCYAHLVDYFPLEVVTMSNESFLDPLDFFLQHASFNTERIDDGYIERLNLPNFNKKKTGKMSIFEVLGRSIHDSWASNCAKCNFRCISVPRFSHLEGEVQMSFCQCSGASLRDASNDASMWEKRQEKRESKRSNSLYFENLIKKRLRIKASVKRICFPAFEEEGVRFQESIFKIRQPVVQKLYASGMSYEDVQREILSATNRTLEFLVMRGEMDSANFMDQVFEDFLDIDSLDPEFVAVHEEPHEFDCSHPETESFHSPESSPKEECNDCESHQPPAKDERADEIDAEVKDAGEESVSHVRHRKRTIDLNNYPAMFEFIEDCGKEHSEPVDVPMDGNCFFHAIKVVFECNEDHIGLRQLFSEYLSGSGYQGLADMISRDGVFMEHELIYAFSVHRQICIIVHVENGRTMKFGNGVEGHLLCKGEHFLGLPTIELFDDLKAGFIKTSGHDERLQKFDFHQSGFDVLKWNGRRSAFLSKVNADYGHNGRKYPYNKWTPCLDEIVDICGCTNIFNSVLIQWYDEGAGINFHRDDESVYDQDEILTVNLKGTGTFSFIYEEKSKGKKNKKGKRGPTNKRDDFVIGPNSFFVMASNAQNIGKHSVTADTERLSLTFRRHVRMMNGSQIIESSPLGYETSCKFKKMCLIDSLCAALMTSSGKVSKTLMLNDRSYWQNFFQMDVGASLMDCEKAAQALCLRLEVHKSNEIIVFDEGNVACSISLIDGHFEALKEYKQMPRSFFSGALPKGSFSAKEGLIDFLLGCDHYNSFDFCAESEYARTLVSSFLSRSTGICLSEVIDGGKRFFSCLNGTLDNDECIMRSVHSLNGFAGSGKSRIMQNWIANRKKSNFCVISPRNALALDWQEKLELNHKDKSKVCTFESFIKKEKMKLDLIVLDELTLFPNGYLDLLVYELEACKSKAEIVVIFDPLQARYHNERDQHLLTFEHEVERMISGKELKYLYSSFRLSKTFFSQFFTDLHMLSDFDTDKSIWVVNDPFKVNESLENRMVADVLLVDSQIEKKAYSSSIKTLTFGESEGLTFDHACIMLSESTASSCEERWMVALTRSRKRVSFCVGHLGGMDEFKRNCKSELFQRFISREGIDFDIISKMTRAKLVLIEPTVGGARDEVDREERLEGDNFLKPFIFLGKRVNLEKIELEEIEDNEPKCQTHLFVSEPNFAQCYNYDLIRLKEDREYREDMLVTDQFCDNYNKNHYKAKTDTAGPYRFKSIYPKHSADDDMTFWMAVKKRLRFRSEDENRRRLNEAHLIGGVLYNNFKHTLGLNFIHDQGLLDKCINDFEVKKLEKSKATIGSHSIRSDTDWALNDVFLFMKSQLCTKYEKQYVDAKAGQTLACFQHLILVQFAPWCRYLEAQIREQLPEEIYIHSNRNFDDLNKWVKKFFMNDVCVESDYEAFDASQDEYILSFEIHLMKDAGLPDSIIDAYIDLKCKLGCKLGHFSIMRFTGEFCTFLFNTLANMAFTFCRYEWRRGQPMAFAGDDMCALSNIPLRFDFEDMFDKLSLKAKVERTTSPMFCGWRLTPYGIVKEPELVYNRFQVAIEEGKVLECLENYAIEVSYAYSLSERLYEVLKSEKQIQYHQAVVRFIVQHLDKLKTKVRNLFEEQSSEEEI